MVFQCYGSQCFTTCPTKLHFKVIEMHEIKIDSLARDYIELKVFYHENNKII